MQGVLDWEFSGAYPMSELLSGGIGVDILEVDGDESDRENTLWSGGIVHKVGETEKQRGWGEKELVVLLSNGDPLLSYARTEMFLIA